MALPSTTEGRNIARGVAADAPFQPSPIKMVLVVNICTSNVALIITLSVVRMLVSVTEQLGTSVAVVLVGVGVDASAEEATLPTAVVTYAERGPFIRVKFPTEALVIEALVAVKDVTVPSDVRDDAVTLLGRVEPVSAEAGTAVSAEPDPEKVPAVMVPETEGDAASDRVTAPLAELAVSCPALAVRDVTPVLVNVAVLAAPVMAMPVLAAKVKVSVVVVDARVVAPATTLANPADA